MQQGRVLRLDDVVVDGDELGAFVDAALVREVDLKPGWAVGRVLVLVGGVAAGESWRGREVFGAEEARGLERDLWPDSGRVCAAAAVEGEDRGAVAVAAEARNW